MGDRCTGHCCKAFVLPYPIDELRRRADKITDGAFIADMVIPLYSGLDEDVPPDILKIAQEGVGHRPYKLTHIYTCRHFDGSQCTQYGSRPEMCREFPYERRCPYPSCEWKAARDGQTETVNGCAVERPRKRPGRFSLSDAPLAQLMSRKESEPC